MANLNLDPMTYRTLKTLVPEVPKGKMPTAKKLEGHEVLLKEYVKGVTITVYKDGYLVYTRIGEDGKAHSSVYAVDRCHQMVFPVNYSPEERTDDDDNDDGLNGWNFDAVATRIAYRMYDGQLKKFHIVDEVAYLDKPWWFPIITICEERIRHNADARESDHFKLTLDTDAENEEGEKKDEDRNKLLLGPDTCAEWEEAEDKKETAERNHNTLIKAMKSLTDIQRRTVDLFYSNPGATERELALEMGVNQSTFHRNLQAALKNLRKFFK